MNRYWLALGALTIGLVGVLASAATADPTERQLSFKGTGGTTIAGTLLLPAGATGPVPALLLIAGSGPTDRNGSQPPGLKPELLKQLAEALASHGIASFRYDKRGMYANAAQAPANTADYGDFFCWENFVGDVVAGYQFLVEQPGIDPARTGLLGHSEGGVLATQAADSLHNSKNPPIVLILLGTPGRPMDVLLTEQLQAILKKQGATDVQAGYFMAANRRILDGIRETGKVPGDVPAGLAALYPAYLGKFFHSAMMADASKLVAKFRGPVLVMNGSDDVQVSAERDAKALDAALTARPSDDHTFVLVPHASHNLKAVSAPGDAGMDGPVVPAVLTELDKWTAAKLVAPRAHP